MPANPPAFSQAAPDAKSNSAAAALGAPSAQGATATPAASSATAMAAPSASADDANASNANPSNDAPDRLAAPELSEDQLIENQMQVAMDLYHAEDYLGCVQTTQEVLDHYPRRDLYKVEYLNAISREHNQQYDTAVTHYEKVIKMHPNSTWSNAASFRVGVCYGMLGQVAMAVNTFRDIIDYNPRSEYHLQAYIHLGNLYRRLSKWDPAIHIYKDIIRLYPCTEWSSISYQYLAECYAHRDDMDTAIRTYRRSQKDPCTPRSFVAQAELRIGDLYMAAEEYSKALDIYMGATREFQDVAGVSLYANEKVDQAKRGRNQDREFELRRRQVQLGGSTEP